MQNRTYTEWIYTHYVDSDTLQKQLSQMFPRGNARVRGVCEPWSWHTKQTPNWGDYVDATGVLRNKTAQEVNRGITASSPNPYPHVLTGLLTTFNRQRRTASYRAASNTI